jgi:hypothetical protein
MNIVFLVDGARFVREQSTGVKVRLAMLELANGWLPGGGPVDGEGAPRYQLAWSIPFLGYGPDREEYLATVADHGSPADDLEQVRARPEPARAAADDALRQAYALGLNPAPVPPGGSGGCMRVAPGRAFEVPAGGMYVRALGGEPATLAASRFGPPPGVSLGAAAPGGWSWVLVPTDPAPEPWRATVTSGRAEVCPVPAPP